MQGGKLCVLIITIILCSGAFNSFGQRSAAYYLEPEHHRALELFDKEKYAAAQAAFDQVVEGHGPNDLIRIAAEYYSARCAMELYNRDAREKMTDFVSEHPDSPWLNNAYFELGRYQYQKHRFDRAIENFEEVEEKELTDAQRKELYFKKGYAHFQEDSFDLASNMLYKVKDGDHDYYGPANYYFAHIAYRRKDHQTALEHFQRVQDHPDFAGIVPYYITQIHFFLGNYESLIEVGPPFLDSSGTERPLEISRLIGEAYYRTEEYEEAIPYLKRYIDKAYGVNREDRYQMGFAYMKAGQGEKALPHFEKVVDREDSLAQVAYYKMGGIHLDQENKKRALHAYRSASRLKTDQELRENALFNYAKLSYELSYDPYDRAIQALRTFLDEFPESERKEDALEYLTRLYMSSRDLDAALESLERMEDKNHRMRTAYQIVAYEKGVEHYLNENFNNAIDLFKKSRIYSMDPELSAQSSYWEAQCYAERGKGQKALEKFDEFRGMTGAYQLPWYERSYYDAGYVFFQDSAYNEAAREFRKFTEAADQQANPEEFADAFQRTGDSYYLSKDYSRAARFYRQASEIEEVPARDRALYQLAVCQGLMGEQEQKVSSLQRLLSEMPDSKFRSQARLQLGKAFVQMERKDRAKETFNELIERDPKSLQAQQAQLQLGLILYQQGQEEEALTRFKKVVDAEVSYELSKEALNRMRNIHVELGTMEEYNAYVADLEGFDLDQEEMDKANYRSAEKLFREKEYQRAIDAFQKYLEEFEPANYGVNARYYTGEALRQTDKPEQAIEYFEEVIERRPNRFSLQALERASRLNRERDSLKRAFQQYRALEDESNSSDMTLKAFLGQLHCAKGMKKDSLVLDRAEKVLLHPELNKKERVRTMMLKGRTLKEKGELQKAEESFRQVVDTTSSEAKAEARYRIAQIQFDREEYEESEKTIYELVHQKPSYKEWVAKGFLLLADVYLKREDRYQAKETLKSLIDLYDGEEVLQKAKDELEKIRKKEEEEELEKRTDTGKGGGKIRMETDSILDER